MPILLEHSLLTALATSPRRAVSPVRPEQHNSLLPLPAYCIEPLTNLAVHREYSCRRGNILHHETQGSQDALTHFVIPRSTLPLLQGQLKSLSRIFCEERGHLPGKLCIVDRDINFIVPDQAQSIKIARSDRRPLSINGAGLRVQQGIAIAKDAHTTMQAISKVAMRNPVRQNMVGDPGHK